MLTSVARKQKSGSYDLGWTREHILPRKLGGRRHENIVLAHLKCNSKRNHAPPLPGMAERCRALWKLARLS